MADLIVGHTTANTTRIWVRGEKRAATCRIEVTAPGEPAGRHRDIALTGDADYTGTADFDALAPDTEYAVTATFTPKPGQAYGRFRTMKRPADGAPFSFSFVLSSCNLPVVRINTFLAFLLAAGGVAVANYSLDVDLGRWKYPKFVLLWWLLRPPVRCVLRLVAGFIMRATDLKQPGQPFLRSPFLKLAAVFDATWLEVETLEADPEVPWVSLPDVGDIVWTSGGKGVVACACEPVEPPRTPKRSRFVITHVEGTLATDELLSKRSVNAKETEQTLVGRISAAVPHSSWYADTPSFFLHAGDQIYYDFPQTDREPDTKEYRLAYREAWFDDAANRYLLSHWPHYMTLDDHEIADQFARDFITPNKDIKADKYRETATGAYREYVHSRNPSKPPAIGPDGPIERFWYTFEKSGAKFFVLDTRMQRWDNLDKTPRQDGQIINEDQMTALLEWMTAYRDELKFVVTSVPFVAEINDVGTEAVITWHKRPDPKKAPDAPAPDAPAPREENPANDQWSAERFRGQRDRIIDHIAGNDIERLVFLTGDMHCCYHATMQVGERKQRTVGSKYDSITVHELAAGPVNQLQLGEIKEFDTRHAGRTRSGIPYESLMDRFHSEVNGVLYLDVRYEKRERVSCTDPLVVPEVEWNVIRTLTDNGPAAWVPQSLAAPGRPGRTPAASLVPDAVRQGEPTMGGRIRFVTKRSPGDLCPWPS